MADQHTGTATATKYVYHFGNRGAEGSKNMKHLLGGKGANLHEMSAIGLPVPPGYTITTEACRYFIDHDGAWPEGMNEQVWEGLEHVESAMDARLGDVDRPLLLSVRSGAAKSMPGMMDTVLNLGLNDEVVEGLARRTNNRRFAFDAYRRLIDMYGHVVMGVDHAYFEAVIERIKRERGVENDIELTADDLETLVDAYKATYEAHVGKPFPSDPHDQLHHAIDAVFRSWGNERAVRYRRIRRITGLIGTGVNVQAMVFGNMDERSGTGVCFTRNPATGAHAPYGEFLQNAQGEDVVAGIRTPEDISALQRVLPEVYDELVDVLHKLETHYQDMEDMEFTVQEGLLYVLQTRDGKRTGTAAVTIAVDMVQEGLISKEHAVRDLVTPDHLDQLLHPHFENEAEYKDEVIGRGLPASPGAAVGQVTFTSEDAEQAHAKGYDVILVRIETSPEDVGGMDAAEGILTSRGGMTSHAAVVARGWGKPCVAGCENLSIDYEARRFIANGTTVQQGDWLSINGSTGEVILGQQPLVEPEMSGEFATFLGWVGAFQPMGVRANADTPDDASKALQFGAEGIGLCRTEHMFFGEERILPIREMIVAESEVERRAALDQLLPFQRRDFEGLFRTMDGHPVTIRLLDPPLHEFVPTDREGLERLAAHVGLPVERVAKKVEAIQEVNPMLGHRGCRLGVTYPSITTMQTRAILEAALNVRAEGVEVHPEIMVPLIGARAELTDQKRVIDETAEAVFAEQGMEIDYLVGTMIEIPRAALTADAVAEDADFFSFGTNDLTQMTFGFSRDDTGSFLPDYLDRDILPDDPFQVLDMEGVGQLVQIGTERGRQTNPGLKVGICGEHGGEPASVAFCYDIGLDYVSCSPFRVPLARLAAAQASLAERDENG